MMAGITVSTMLAGRSMARTAWDMMIKPGL
jgi:hypothetical protein